MMRKRGAQHKHLHAENQPLMEALSIINATVFYSEELRKISDGHYTPELLSEGEKRKLSKMGLIQRWENQQYVVPWEVEKLLENLK